MAKKRLKINMSTPSNQVLTDDARSSGNFFESDVILRHYLARHLPQDGLEYMDDNLRTLGRQAATEMDALSQTADKQSPRLTGRTPLGEKQNSVEFHPAYWKLVDRAAESEMFAVKYQPDLRERFSGSRHALGFAAGQIYAMSELGIYCPLCMTDGAAHLVDRFASEEVRSRLLPRLASSKGAQLYTGAMFLTEKSGGSDVGRNIATARHEEGNRYRLNGEKWFCSNVNADVIMALARTGDAEAGTRGLSLFLVEKELPDGSQNPIDIIRLKEKLGVRSMATGEVEFNDTIGLRLGEENAGFKVMTEMINISRMYNAVAALAGSRRALIEAYEYLNHRVTFGKRATQHALIRQKFLELGSGYIGDFLLVWRAICAMDNAEQGDETARHLMRILIPMAKWRSAEHSVYTVRECMELMGGNGYIEDFVMPKLLRDVNVLPIWEGSGNIIVLDMLRASEKSNGLDLIIKQIQQSARRSERYGQLMSSRLDELLEVWQKVRESGSRDITEATAKPLFEELIQLYQLALMVDERDDSNAAWITPALNATAAGLQHEVQMQQPPEADQIAKLMGWNY